MSRWDRETGDTSWVGKKWIVPKTFMKDYMLFFLLKNLGICNQKISFVPAEHFAGRKMI